MSVPSAWLADLLLKPGKADQYKTFLINNPDVLGLFGWKQEHEKYFSFAQLQPHLGDKNHGGHCVVILR